MIYLVFYSALACWLLAMVRSAVVGLLLLFAIAVMIGIALLVARRRSAQQRVLLGVLAIAMERGMPLAPALMAFADQFPAGYRRKVRSLAHLLNAGAPLPDALDRVRGVLPGDVGVLVRSGWEAGALAAAVREADGLGAGVRQGWFGLVGRLEYFLGLLLFAQCLGGWLCVRTVPQTSRIFMEFKVAVPEITREIFAVSERIHDRPGLLVLPMLAELLIVLGLLSTLYGWSRFRLPLIDRLLSRRHAAVLLRSLAWLIEGGVPLTRALPLLSKWYPAPRFKVLLSRASQDVNHGSDWVDSLRYHCVVGRTDAALIESARRVGNLPWALRQAAETCERRLAGRLQVVGHVVLALVVLSMGGLVATLGVAYFIPLSHVIEGLVP
jgi:protein transport protein HofC